MFGLKRTTVERFSVNFVLITQFWLFFFHVIAELKLKKKWKETERTKMNREPFQFAIIVLMGLFLMTFWLESSLQSIGGL